MLRQKFSCRVLCIRQYTREFLNRESTSLYCELVENLENAPKPSPVFSSNTGYVSGGLSDAVFERFR